MGNQEIVQTVAEHVIGNSEFLLGCLKGEYFFDIRGKYARKSWLASHNTAFGYAIDILADLIESNNFFGNGVGPSRTACHENNARISLLSGTEKDGLVGVTGKFLGSNERGIVRVQAPIVEKKPYLDPLRTEEGLRSYTQLVNLADSLPKDKQFDKYIDNAVSLLF